MKNEYDIARENGIALAEKFIKALDKYRFKAKFDWEKISLPRWVCSNNIERPAHTRAFALSYDITNPEEEEKALFELVEKMNLYLHSFKKKHKEWKFYIYTIEAVEGNPYSKFYMIHMRFILEAVVSIIGKLID